MAVWLKSVTLTTIVLLMKKKAASKMARPLAYFNSTLFRIIEDELVVDNIDDNCIGSFNSFLQNLT